MTIEPQYRKIGVLYVDDEEQALKYFRKGLNRDFQIHTAINVAEARTLLETHSREIGVVISDQRMPGESGVQLLTEVRRRWPDMVRILITAFADIESAVDAVNSGAIYKYIHKPADLKVLRETLQNALALFATQQQRKTIAREKLGVLQRQIVQERVRGFAALAGGLSHHLRNSMMAMSCFLEEAGEQGSTPAVPGEANASYVGELLTIAQTERARLLEIVESVGQGVVQPGEGTATDENIVELTRSGLEGAFKEVPADKVVCEFPASALPLRAEAEKIVLAVKSLITYAYRLGGRRGTLKVVVDNNVTVGNTAAVRVMVSALDTSWTDRDMDALFTPFAFAAGDPSDLGLEMLSALFTAYRHAGDIVVHRVPPAGPAFELLLPIDPAQVTGMSQGSDLIHAAVSDLGDGSDSSRAA